MLLLFVITIGTVLHLVGTQKSSSVAINDCGKLRMLSQRIAKASLQTHVEPYGSRAELNEAISEYERLLTQLIEGDPLRMLNPAEGAILAELEELRTRWSEYRRQAERLLAVDVSEAASESALNYLATENTVLLHRANGIVSMLEAASRQKVDRLLAMLFGLLVAGCALFIALSWALKRSLRPLQELTSLAEQVSRGDYRYQKRISSHDEVGSLAEAFYAMLEKISNQVHVLELTAREMETARRHAEETLSNKQEMLAIMSHELRTPLNGIIGMTSILNQTELDEDQRHFAHVANVSGRALLETIEGVLDFSRLEAGKLTLDRLEFSPLACVEEAVDIVSYFAECKGLELRRTVSKEVPEIVVGDATRLRQVLVNLFANAIKFTKKGHVAIEVSYESQASGGELLFSVTDTGIGLDRSEQGHLFQFYSQATPETSKEYGGSGLGLAISKTLVEAMGGRIWVESEKGQGTTFRFTIKTIASKRGSDSAQSGVA